MRKLINHLKSNDAELSIDRLIIIVIAFVAGAVIIGAVTNYLYGIYGSGSHNRIGDILD